MLYAIDATVVRRIDDAFVMTQIPTFYLDSNVQGIVDEDHAVEIAESIINPAKLKTVKVNAFAVNTWKQAA